MDDMPVIELQRYESHNSENRLLACCSSAYGLAGGDYAEQELGDDFVKQACPRLVTAMDKMEQWLNSL